jgi:hypothetical protein
LKKRRTAGVPDGLKSKNGDSHVSYLRYRNYMRNRMFSTNGGGQGRKRDPRRCTCVLPFRAHMWTEMASISQDKEKKEARGIL